MGSISIQELRALLERLEQANDASRRAYWHPVTGSVVRVGLQACDEWQQGYRPDKVVWTLEVVANILRQSGVEVGTNG